MPIKGHSDVEKHLDLLIQSNRIPNAIILSGREGIGKSMLAHKFASKLLNTEFQKVSVHPDLLAIKSDEGALKVDEVRRVGEFMSHTSSFGGYKIVIVDAADEMNRNASNSVLKVLEEPPKNSVLILVSHNIQKLLPTIRSRCHKITLKPLSLSDFKEAIKADVPEALYDMSQGSPGIALWLYKNDAISKYQELTSAISDKNIVQLLDFASNASDKKDLEKWNITKFLLLYFLSKKAKHNANNSKIISELFSKAQAQLNATDNLYLDKSQVIFNVLVKIIEMK